MAAKPTEQQQEDASRRADPESDPGGLSRAAPGGGLLTVLVNGERRATRAATLGDLIAEAGYGDARVATALNGAFVPQRARDATGLAEGDRIEIVAPRQGG